MFDLKNAEPESALRLFIVESGEYFTPLLKLKQADFSACKDDLSVCPTVKRWTTVYREMKLDGTPFSLKELNVTPAELLAIGFKRRNLGEELKRLFEYAVTTPKANDFAKLKAKAEEDFNGGFYTT